MSAERVLYLSYFYPLDVVKSRRLPTQNVAGNNRMRRITGALASAHCQVHIVSPGICAQCGFSSRPFDGAHSSVDDGTEVTVAPAVVVPFVGAMLEVLFFPLWVLLFLSRRRFEGAVFYNYSLSFALLAVLFRVLGIPFVAEVEDVAVPSRSDWLPGAETRPVQQLVLWLCMRVVTGLSAGLLVPSKRFLHSLPANKPFLSLPGCIADSEWGADRPVRLEEPIRVLFVGGYEIEHGLDVFVSLLDKLRFDPSLGSRFAFDCCGTRNYPPELQLLSNAGEKPEIRLHGFLSDEEYRSLLAASAVTLVLQRARGRHANFKSPSKAYEFLAAGKIVIATDVGDLASLDGRYLTLLRQESSEELMKILVDVAENPANYARIAAAAREFSRRESSYAAVGMKLNTFFEQVFRGQ